MSLEDLGVELTRLHPHQIARRPGHHQLVAQQLAKRRDPRLDLRNRGGRRRLIPKGVDQPVDRDDLVGARQQQRGEGLLLDSPQGKALSAGPDRHRAKDLELHVPPKGEALHRPARIPTHRKDSAATSVLVDRTGGPRLGSVAGPHSSGRRDRQPYAAAGCGRRLLPSACLCCQASSTTPSSIFGGPS